MAADGVGKLYICVTKVYIDKINLTKIYGKRLKQDNALCYVLYISSIEHVWCHLKTKNQR